MAISPAPLPPNEMTDFDPPVVLLAEDDDAFRALVASTLRRDGYDVIEAPDGEHLQRLIREMCCSWQEPRPELIISDIRMPGGSGLDALRTLRDLDPFTPVILMTGFGSAQTTRDATRLGAWTVLAKPFDLSALRRRVRELLPLG